ALHSTQALLASLPQASAPALTEIEAMTLAAYPLSCLDNLQAAGGRRGGYLWQSEGATRLLGGYGKARAFYGCYDWHSAVNSTWTLVTLLQRFPQLPVATLIREKLNAHLGKSNLEGELKFFQASKSFERPYGQAWLLKLYGSLLQWNDPDAKKWAANMAPLAQFFSKNLTTYFTQLPTPVRTGVHPNTAFDMDLVLPYTEADHDAALHQAVFATSRRFYAGDAQCPTGYEPAGVSFLSPCLVEGALMTHVLPAAQYVSWLNNFLPSLYSPAFRPLLQPFDPSKMKPDQMAGQSHLVGLAFSRAAAMLTIVQALPPNDPRIPVLRRLASIHAVQGYKTLDEAGYLETHWIATYALMYQLDAAPATVATPARAVATNRQR
ncbi:MAG: DUF2891 family protein, partial [Terriglobales bacterium]